MRQESVDNQGNVRHWRAGMEHYHRGCFEQAAAELHKVSSETGLTGSLGRYYEAMARRAVGLEALQAGRFDEAEGHLRAASEALGGYGDLAEYLARLYARSGKYDCCERQTAKVLQSKADSPQAWAQHAAAQWRCGEQAAAYLTVQEALRRFENDASLLLQLGLFKSAEGDYAGAAECFSKAAASDRSLADAYYYLAMAQAAQNDPLSAVKSLQQAYELRGGDLLLAHKLSLAARAASQQGHNVVIKLTGREAAPVGSHMRQLARYITTEGDFVDAMLALPESSCDQEMFSLLAGVLQMVLEEHPNYADLHFHAAGVYMRLGQIDKAIEHGCKAVAINGKYVRARILLGQCCAQAGRAQEAFEHLEQAIAAGGDWADVHCQAGELYLQLGKADQARQHLERAIQLNSRFTLATEMLSRMAA